MIHSLRKKSNSFVAKTAFGLLALTFVAGGVGSSIIGSHSITALTINGEKVPAQEMQNRYNAALRDLQRRAGGTELSDELIQAFALGSRTIHELVKEHAIIAEANKIGLRGSDNQIRAIIESSETFKNELGEFDKDNYKRILSNSGLTAEGYESSLRKSIQEDQLASLFKVHSIDSGYAKQMFNYANETLSVRYVEIKNTDLPKIKAPKTAEIEDFYNDNAERFSTEEIRDYSMLALKQSTFGDAVAISDEEAKAEYDADPESFALPTKRTVSHILLAKEDEANAIYEEIQNGADFSVVANEKSSDVFTSSKGGLIGDITETEMDPAFTKAAFDASIGDVVKPVETALGWHVIKVSAEIAGKARDFETVKAEIVNELKLNQTEDAYYKAIEKLDDMIASGETLADTAKALNLTLTSYKGATISNIPGEYADHVESELFALQTNEVSAPIEVNGGLVTLLINVDTIHPSRQQTLAEATAEISDSLTALAKQKALSDKASELLVKAKEKGLKVAANTMGMSRKVAFQRNIDRDGANAPVWMKTAQLNTLFRTQPGNVSPNIINTTDGMAVVEVVSRTDGNGTSEEQKQYSAILRTSVANDLYSYFVADLADDAKVERNDPVLESIMGVGYKTDK